MFGRSQRTCLPSLSLQNPPIDFVKAAASKDSAHARSKIDHDRSKHSLSPLSPGQHVHLQDSKSSAWECVGIIVSMQPDKLSYVINVDNQFFTRPQSLLRPVVLESSDTPPPICPARVSPPLLRRSKRLQSRATSSSVQTSVLPPISSCSSQPSASSIRLPRRK